jgi:hypothetical protein
MRSLRSGLDVGDVPLLSQSLSSLAIPQIERRQQA